MGTIKAPDWAVVTTHPACDDLAFRSLRRAGYRTLYLTRLKISYPHGREKRYTQRLVPLFPGYLFCQDWRGFDRPINGTSGLFRIAGEIAMMPDADLARLWDRERNREFDDPRPQDRRARREDLVIGGKVEVERHGITIRAAIEELSHSGRVIIRAISGLRVTIDDPQELVVVDS